MASKSTSQRNERILTELRAREGNDTCADCGSRQPRWASWNLGIWLCVKCATIHRRMGTHISRVKSLSLDIWTKEQVESMRDNGNIKSNTLFNPNPRNNPPPLDLESEHAESQLERFIFQKYRDRAFMDKPKKKSSSSSRVDSTSSPTVSRTHAPAPVATIRESGASYRSGESAPNTARTPAVSITSPQSVGERAFSPPAMPIATQQPSTHLSAAATSAGRAMTAPLPDYSTRSLSPSVSSNRTFNPFHRQMTASAQIPSATGMPPQISSMGYSSTGTSPYKPTGNAPYPQSNMSSSFGQMPVYKPATMPLHQSNPPKGEVWQDLAGLSLSNGGTQVQQPMLSSFNAYQSSTTAMPMPMLQTNPFLQSSMMTYKAPSQISSMSSGSSFSSLGSASSATFSPNYAQMHQQTPAMPTYQYQAQTSLAPTANSGMPYMGMNQQQQPQQVQQQVMPMIQQQSQHRQQPYQFHASNPYASQFAPVQQPYPQYVQNQYQGM